MGHDSRFDPRPEYREQLKKRMLAEAAEARKHKGENGGANLGGGCLFIIGRFLLLGFVLAASLWGS